MARGRMVFPSDFLWGTATSSYQVEGNNRNSDWWQWEMDGRISNNDRSGLASNWWQDAETDLDLAAEMGTNAHRLSLEWSRIEPEPSRFDADALTRYREILQGMVDRGIEPMVTLHHFSNPIWLTEKKDFNSRIVVEYFKRYSEKVAESLGDLVPKWVTINEPMVYATFRYLRQEFPAPSATGWLPMLQCIRNLLRCHAVAYHAIKAHNPQAQVGVAKNVPIFQPKEAESRLDRWWTGRLQSVFNEMWMRSMTDGRFYWPAGRERLPHLANSYDFIGINYYSRYYAHFPPSANIIEQAWKPDAVVTDGNFSEVYPEGLFQAIKLMLPYKKPIYITENGCPDGADEIRPSFIVQHLRELWRAISFCFPIMGYYHWSLIDNFEWHNGWSQRFGLIGLDPDTQQRHLRPSGQLYGEICRTGQLNSEMVEKYVPHLMRTLFPGESPQPTV